MSAATCLRSILTALGTMVLVLVVTLVWSVLHLIDTVTAEKSHDLKAFISERWSVPSRLPLFLRIVAGRRRCPQGPSGGRPPHGLDDLAVLRRHARSEEPVAPVDGLLHRLRARQDPHDDVGTGGPFRGRGRRAPALRPAAEGQARRHHPGAEPPAEPEPDDRRRPARHVEGPAGPEIQPQRLFDLEGPGPRFRDRGRISARPLRRPGRHQSRLLQRRPGRLSAGARRAAAPHGRSQPEPGPVEGGRQGSLQPRGRADHHLALSTTIPR